jgi:DDE superfamily endonuclease
MAQPLETDWNAISAQLCRLHVWTGLLHLASPRRRKAHIPFCTVFGGHDNVWGPSTQRIEIPMTNFRERQTYYGAIEPLSAEVIVVPTDTANGYWTTIFVEYLRQQHPEKRLILLWDGASYHRGVEMQEYLEALNLKRSRDEWLVTCVLFAPNAPEQNPMEDLTVTGIFRKGVSAA